MTTEQDLESAERIRLETQAQMARMNLINFELKTSFSKISDLITKRGKMVALLLKRKGKKEEPK
jgi:hypothetical protein